jgi:hypothetical protein
MMLDSVIRNAPEAAKARPFAAAQGFAAEEV